MKYWEVIADNLHKAGWSLGWVSAIDSSGRTIWIVDAHGDDRKRFVVRADEKLSTFLDCSDQGYVGTLVLIHVIENATLIVIYTAVIIAQRLGKGDSPRSREFVALPGKYFVSGSP
jgi:hypothetical protein